MLLLVQANCGPREPLSKLRVNEASGAGDPAVHGEARDVARSRLQRQPVRILPRQERRPTHPAGRKRKTKTKRRVSCAPSLYFENFEIMQNEKIVGNYVHNNLV